MTAAGGQRPGNGRLVARVGVALVVLAAARTAWLAGAFTFHQPDVRLYHVQSAGLAFVLLGVLVALGRSRSEPGVSSSERVPVAFLAAACALALWLYWPGLFVSFLSDDFVLLALSSDWRLGPVTPELFRPLPMLLWAVLEQVHSTPLIFHAVNILLHGINAYLVAQVASGWTRHGEQTPLVAATAGVVFLTYPLAVEPVVWVSGVFDVLATSWVLLLVLVSRQYGDHAGIWVRLSLVVCAVGALASKETGAIGAVLVLLDCWSRRRLPRRLAADLMAVGLLTAGYSLWRLSLAAAGSAPPPSLRYAVQGTVFGTFGALAAPWSQAVLAVMPWLAAIQIGCLVVILTAFFVSTRTRQRLAAVAIAGCWVLVPLLPVFPFFGPDPDLQGSRYLYMAAPGWAAIVALMAAELGRSSTVLRWCVWCGLAVVVAAQVAEVRVHIRPWTEASTLLQRIEQAAVRDIPGVDCAAVRLEDLPDALDGAYLLRNGAREAFARLRVSVDTTSTVGCTFRWVEATGSFQPVHATSP